jgi:hypothetical protein
MARKKTKRRAKKKSPTVTVRFANGARTMAKRRKRRKSSGKRRRKNPATNPANPRRRRRRVGARRVSRRRRRNPAGGFGDRLIKLGLGAAVAVGTGVAVTYGMGKIMPGTKTSLYGVPAVAFVAGVAMAKSMPTLGTGIALGAFTPFALPLASKMLSAGIPSANAASTAGAISRAYRSVSAVNGYGHRWNPSMGAVDMHGADMMMYGATNPRDMYRAR